MNNATQTLATSENEINEIKINMTFEEAVEITQETYNNYQANADNDLSNLDIQKFQNIQNPKGNFKLYHKIHDIDSNFSGMTYIYKDEEANAVNVAIASRGSVTPNPFTKEGRKDWLRNNSSMFWKSNTVSDNFAKEYATKILEKIQQQYLDKQINIITLGHSKGGREAQKQMLALLEKYRDDETVNICCLTFNSAPIAFYEFCQIGKHKDYCQNLYFTDNSKTFKDILNSFNDKFKYGNNCAYTVNKQFSGIIVLLSLILVPIAVYIYFDFETKMPLLAFLITLLLIIIPLCCVLFFSKSLYIILSCILVITFLLLNFTFIFYISLLIVIILVLAVLPYYTHGINVFKDEKSLYKKLKEKNVSKIIRAKDLDKL